MRLKIVARSAVVACALALVGAEAFAIALPRSASTEGLAAGNADPLQAFAYSSDGVIASGSGAYGSFQFSARPGHWVSEFLPGTGRTPVEQLSGAAASGGVTVARYASFASLAPQGVVGHGVAAGLAFSDAAAAASRSEDSRQPNSYAMLFAGLALIGLMARQRIGGA